MSRMCPFMCAESYHARGGSTRYMNKGVSGGCSCGVGTRICVIAIKLLKKGVATHVDNLYGPLSKKNRAVKHI